MREAASEVAEEGAGGRGAAIGKADMMVWLAEHAASLSVVAAILLLTTAFLAFRGMRHHETMRRLSSADRLLSEHAVLLRRLVEADIVPSEFKAKLLAFSSAAVDDETFALIWREVCDDTGRHRDSSTFNRDLAAIYALDPDLGSCFEQAVYSLMAAMVLKSGGALGHLAEAFASAEPRALFASAIDARHRKERSTAGGGLLTA